MTGWAHIAVARPLSGALTYAVPAWMAGDLRLGHVVEVPLGRQRETGWVVGFPDAPDFDPAKAKPVTRILDPEPVFDAEQLAFYQWIADYYLVPVGMVVRTATPSEVRARSVRVVVPTEEGVEALAAGLSEDGAAGPRALVLREVVARAGLTPRGLARRLGQELDAKAVRRALDGLVRRGLAQWDERSLQGVQGRETWVVRQGTDEAARACLTRPGKRMAALLDALEREGGAAKVAALSAAQGATVHDALRRLEAAGAVVKEEREVRDVLADAPPLGAVVPPTLNADQTAALAALTGEDRARPWLLFGVTGSGKTEVFLGAAAKALARGQQVCVLVPEIGLTPQLVGRFRARFGDGVAVLHSGLSGGERLAHWRRIRAGEASVAVGARSALFAPFRDLGLIVVDEEHDDSYKQDDGVRYHARDLAVVLGHRRGCPVVLASATPSLESWHNAQSGRYGLLRLPTRATPRPVPAIELVDMTEVDKDEDGRRPLFAPEVLSALGETFDTGGQAIVLYNRRGFATMVQCGSCGASYDCPNCGISMTLHRRDRVMACHYCGYRRPIDPACPACGAHDLQELGRGTERVHDVLAEAFPGVAMARMDADTTTTKGAHHAILDSVRSGKVQLLVGTQIVAKGHDLPGVQTAVVVSADHGLRMPDFRSAERTVSLVVQAAGRAGRGQVPGRVLVQTGVRDHAALENLGDVEAFLEREQRQRQILGYPPWTRLVLVGLDGVKRPQVAQAANALAHTLGRMAPRDRSVEVLPAAAAALPRLVGRWRFQLIVRSRDVRALRRFLVRARSTLEGAGGRGVRVQVDVDPRHLM